MGTEEFWVPAVLAAVSAGAQYANTSAANSRQQSAEAQAINNQMQIRNKGNALVNQTVQGIAKDNPQQIAAQETGNYVAQLRRNAAGSTQGGSTSASPSLFGQSTSALAPGVVGSSQYKADSAKAQAQVQAYGNTEATEMGDLDAAVRERQNEGLEMQTLGTNLNTLNSQSYNQNFVDQLRAQTAGQTNPYIGLMASLLGNAGTTISKNPQWITPPSTPANPGSSIGGDAAQAAGQGWS